MTDYQTFLKTHWRGFYDTPYSYTSADLDFIRASKAVSYNDLLNEAITLKKAELDTKGGQPFYEPSTYYGSFKDAHYHSDYKWVASRYASNLYFTYYRMQRELDQMQRNPPTELPDHVRYLWDLINENSQKEPWMWPLMQLHDGWYTRAAITPTNLPVIHAIMTDYLSLAKGTEDEFFSAVLKIRELIKHKGY